VNDRAGDGAPGGARVRAVVVAWGRSGTLAGCLDAIEAACAGVAHEIVVVLAPGDPAAAEAARRAQVRVPAAGEATTPGANRNRGAAGATAPYLAFVDGDAVLDPSFLAPALARLDAEPAVGGVGGRVHERQWERGRLVREIPDAYRAGSGGEVEMLATAWLARRSAFEAVGGFDARLPAEEDIELCLRLADAGHPVVALDRRVAWHDCPPRPSLAEFRRRWRSGLYAGQGLLLRYAWGTPAFGRHLARQRLYLGAFAALVAGGVLAVASLAGAGGAPVRAALVAWLAGAALAVLVMAVRKGGLGTGALAVATWVVLGAGIVRAWALGPRGGGAR
jgi:glycosyltransferase involved in cell wall biosynthesis